MSDAWQYYLDPEARRAAKKEFLEFLITERNDPREKSLWPSNEVLVEIEMVKHDLESHAGWDCGCGG